MSAAETAKLKDMCIETSLGEAQIVIPAADAPATQAADTIQARIRELGGPEIPIRSDTEVEAGAQPVHTIALGILMDNVLIASLYWQWYTMVDRRYPGKGGYALHSVHNPWGNDRNVFIVGVSDGKGLSRGGEGIVHAGLYYLATGDERFGRR